MTHYTINYKGLSEAEAKTQAISDIKDWMGEERYNKITQGCKTATDENGNPETMTWPQWRMAMFLSGVEGYPLKVWYNEIWPNGVIEEQS